MDAISPTKVALMEHIKRTVYQGRHIVGEICFKFLSNCPHQKIGLVNNWKKLWTVTLPASCEASASRELLLPTFKILLRA